MSIEWKSGNKCLYNQTDCLSGVEFNFTLIYQGPLRFDQKKKEKIYFSCLESGNYCEIEWNSNSSLHRTTLSGPHLCSFWYIQLVSLYLTCVQSISTFLNPTVLGSNSAKAWSSPSALTDCQDSRLPQQAYRDILVFVSSENIWGFQIDDSQISEVLQCSNYRT